MKRDSDAHLHDILDAGEMIREFTSGMSLADYSGNALVKAAVERKVRRDRRGAGTDQRDRI